MVRFAVAVLATWRVTHLLAREDGPADVIVRFRALLGDSLAGSLMDCFNCLSLWIAAPVALAVSRGPTEWLLNWLALSGGASLVERMTREADIFQGGEFSDVLRSETFGPPVQSATETTPIHPH